MSKATQAKLATLHGVVADTLTKMVTPVETEEGVVLPPAANVLAAITFLKNNSVTADPETNDRINTLKERLQAKRKDAKQDIQSLAEAAESYLERSGMNLQ